MEQKNTQKSTKNKKRVVLAIVISCIFIAAIAFIWIQNRNTDKTIYSVKEYSGMTFRCPENYLVEKNVLIEGERFNVRCISPKKLEQFLEKNFIITWDKRESDVSKIYQMYLTFNGIEGMSYLRDYDSKMGDKPCKVIDYSTYGGMSYGRFFFFKSGNSVVIYQTEADDPKKLDEQVFKTVGESIEIK